MTNTEAITKLTNIMHDDHYAWHPSILTAFGMAVDALKADGDSISRQTLKEAFVETSLLEWEQLKKYYPMLKVVDEVPSAQPDWNEMIVMCDCCGHAIHVKRIDVERREV